MVRGRSPNGVPPGQDIGVGPPQRRRPGKRGWGAGRALFVLAIGLVIACEAGESPTELTPGHPLALEVQSLTTGYELFFFPPLGEDPLEDPRFDPGTFAAYLKPTVEICALQGDACAEPQPAGYPLTYTVNTGPGGETVVLDPESDAFLVYWRTAEFTVDPDVNYRVTVTLDGVILGFADTDPWTDPKEKAMASSEGPRPVHVGSTLSIRFRIEPVGAAAIMVAEAITVTDASRVIPPDAVRIEVAEQIAITDALEVLPPLAIEVAEQIAITDALEVLPPVEIRVEEGIAVTDQVDVSI